MSREIKKAVVLGAGTMGSGIAAHLANAGVEVWLLDDYVPTGAADRAAFPKSAIDRMLKAAPTDFMNNGFMAPESAKLITPGNMNDDLEAALKDADWVVEAVREDLDIKRGWFAKIDALKKLDAIVSSNTSTIPLHDLVEGRSGDFKKNFTITHFFNPVRFMHLLELVSGPQTERAATDTLRDFCDKRLGKNVVECNDTPGFIANRIGTYFLFRTMAEALKRNMKIEDVDAVMGRPLGLPKSGVFGLMDVVGLGLTPHLIGSLQRTLPTSDPLFAIDSKPCMDLINKMIAEKRTGRASPTQSGFYRLQRNDDGSRVKQVMDLATGDYRAVSESRSTAVKAGKQGPHAVFTAGEKGDPLGSFAWEVMRDTLTYAAGLIPEVSNDIAAIDAAMRDGYGWKWGPFEMIDKINNAWFTGMARKTGPLPRVLEGMFGRSFYLDDGGVKKQMAFTADGVSMDYKPVGKKDGTLSLSDIKAKSKPVVTHGSASTWDIGDGVLCFEFHSKMNAMDPSILHTLNETIKKIAGNPERYKALVIYNEGENFSVGANLGLVQKGFELAERAGKIFGKAAQRGVENLMYKFTDNLVYSGQAVYRALREAPFPVIGAPKGMALGGGCEILLHCDAVQASAETYTGLVESGVGLIPGWGGCSRMLERFQQATQVKGPLPALKQTFMNLIMPPVSSSAQDAKKKMWLRADDGITMNADRLLADAKTRALAMVPGYKPPAPAVFRLPGAGAATALKMGVDDFYLSGLATWHDVVVGDALGDALSGGNTHIGIPVNESAFEHSVREQFMSLVHTDQTKARITHMLKNGKPLREAPLDTPTNPDDIRATRRYEPLPPRVLDGKPLSGAEATTLRRMADVTSWLIKKFT